MKIHRCAYHGGLARGRGLALFALLLLWMGAEVGARLHAAEGPPRARAGQPLTEVLQALQTRGVKLLYSSALVKPGMKVRTAAVGKTPRELLEKILAPNGLQAKSGPNGTVLVVKGKRAAGTGANKNNTSGVVSFVKVLSDKVPDVSSLGAWKKSFIRDGMSDKEKALAVWKSAVSFMHQETPPIEFVGAGSQMDPIKLFNVYGYAMCNSHSSNIESLSRYLGLKARGWGINRHSVPEVFWGGAWHLLDASLINYAPKPGGGIASVKEIMAGVKEWYAQHPGYKKNDKKLRQFMRNGGWKKGPAILAQSPFYDRNGWLPAATHGWYATMQEYDGSRGFLYEYGCANGYQVNVQLRSGERLTRNWFNKGLHVNMKGGGGKPGCMKMQTGKSALRYTPQYGDLAPGRIGNGTLLYDVPLAGGAFRQGALKAENLAGRSENGKGPALRVQDGAKPGVLVLRMPCSYVYLTGKLSFQATLGEGGSIAVSFSDNNGLDWTLLEQVTSGGLHELNLSEKVFRRYDYRLKFVLKGKGAGLEALKIEHDIQHSQRALPALAQGSNSITFNAGPAEGTVTIAGTTDVKRKSQQLHYTDFHPLINNITDSRLCIKGSQGEITFPIETPGAMVRLRFGTHYRARDKRDGWDISVSYDGKEFKKIHHLPGPTAASSDYFTYKDAPAGTKKAWVRFSGTQRNTTCLFNLRIDADYTEPRGGFAPLKITFLWEENGQPKRDVHVARKPHETYTINCQRKPLMKSLIVERAE